MTTIEPGALAEVVLEATYGLNLGVILGRDDGTHVWCVHVNSVAAELLGCEGATLVGTTMAAIVAPEGQSHFHQLTTRWRSGDATSNRIETLLVRKDRGRVPVEIAFSTVPGAKDGTMVAVLRDLSEMESLRRSESRFRGMIEAAPDAASVLRHGRFIYVNEAHVRLFGRPAEELLDREMTEFIHPDDRLGVVGRSDGILEPRAPGEYRVLQPSGRVVHFELSCVPIEYDGEAAVLGFARDTTERKQTQARLAFADRMATLGMLAAGAAHEINNPLGYAMLNVEILAQRLKRSGADTSPPIELAITAARDGLARVAAIVRDLRTFSSPPTEERWPVDVEAVLESAVTVVMHAIRGRARLVRSYAPAPPLKTDPSRLGQVLLNLLANAAQSFESGDESSNELSLSIACRDDDHVLVTVADTGPGIAKADLERIFEPFYTTKTSGTGLGLAISQTLITSLGGKLGVESAIGHGTKFTVELPTQRLSR